MMSPDERIKELNKQGYISGVMAGKMIRKHMNELVKFVTLWTFERTVTKNETNKLRRTQ